MAVYTLCLQFVVKKVEEEEEKVFRVWDLIMNSIIIIYVIISAALEGYYLFTQREVCNLGHSQCVTLTSFHEITHWSGQHRALEEVKWEYLTDQIPFRLPNSLEA